MHALIYYVRESLDLDLYMRVVDDLPDDEGLLIENELCLWGWEVVDSGSAPAHGTFDGAGMNHTMEILDVVRSCFVMSVKGNLECDLSWRRSEKVNS